MRNTYEPMSDTFNHAHALEGELYGTIGNGHDSLKKCK